MFIPSCREPRASGPSKRVYGAEVAREPARLAGVHDEPALASRLEPAVRALEGCLGNHAAILAG